MINRGGLKKANPELWLSNTGSGNSSGCVCFFLLPEIAAIFQRNLCGPSFLYAVELNGYYFLPGSVWREIISPGAFPLIPDTFFASRQLLGIKENGQLELGQRN